MGLESSFAYGGCGPWSNQLHLRLLGAPPSLERDFCAHFALVCLSSYYHCSLTAPPERLAGTPYVAGIATDGSPVLASIQAAAAAAATAAAAALSGRAAAFFGRFCGAQTFAPVLLCVSCGVDFGRWEPRATPARVRAAQARSGGGMQLHRGHQEHG
jgi:hypothetical protein